MTAMRVFVLAIILACITLTALAAPSDEQIKETLVQQSVTGYLSSVGNCPCPYNRDKAGRMCGKRSAWSKGGGYSPLCYPSDVKKEMILEYRNKIFMNHGGTDDPGPFKQHDY